MTKQANLDTKNLRRALSVALSVATLAIVLTYVLGAQAILQTSYAEPAHNMYMSTFAPLIQGLSGDHASMSQMHGGPASESQAQGNMGLIGNNMLGSPTGMAAAGLAAVTVQGAIVFAAAAFVISWKQKSLIVAGLLAASGATLMIPPLANMNFVVPGPIIGVVVGLGILGLGVAKGVRTARTVPVKA